MILAPVHTYLLSGDIPPKLHQNVSKLGHRVGVHLGGREDAGGGCASGRAHLRHDHQGRQECFGRR